MKTFIAKIAFILLIQGFSSFLFAHVELDYPLGGESFTVGQTVTIEWHIAIAHNTLNLDVLFSSDGGNSWEAIQMDLPPGSLSYTWIVPSNITAQARVSVIQDNSAQDYQDESLNFNIVLPLMPPAIVTAASNLTIESDINHQVDIIQDWLDNHGGASANGFCGDLIWSDNFITLSNGCGATGSAVVTFTVIDPCGSTETVATVTVNDTAPPVLNTTASSMTVQCDGAGNLVQLNTWLQNKGGATASDAGGNLIWANDYSTLSNGCSSTGNATVIFTATDDCGNHTETSANFAIEDHIAPVLQTPAQDIIIECGLPNTQAILQNWLLNNGGATASDVCGTVIWTNNFPTSVDSCQASTFVSVTFTAVDDCGNSSMTSATVTFMGTLGITNAELSDVDFTISPNPVHDMMKVEFAGNESSFERITLFDALGYPVEVYQEIANEMYIPVKGIAPGLYYLQVQTSFGVGIRKVVIE